MQTGVPFSSLLSWYLFSISSCGYQRWLHLLPLGAHYRWILSSVKLCCLFGLERQYSNDRHPIKPDIYHGVSVCAHALCPVVCRYCFCFHLDNIKSYNRDRKKRLKAFSELSQGFDKRTEE